MCCGRCVAKTESFWVLDTSVVAAWFFDDDPSHDESLAVRAHLKDHASAFVVPPLFYSELVHVLARKSGRRASFVRAALLAVLHLGLRTVPLREAALLRSATWACKGLGGYDATFVALGEDLNAKWITADVRAARKAGAARALALGSWTAGSATR
jgi:predicted nucleic acid-binding protein